VHKINVSGQIRQRFILYLKMSNRKHRHINYFMPGMKLVHKGFSYSVGLMEKYFKLMYF